LIAGGFGFDLLATHSLHLSRLRERSTCSQSTAGEGSFFSGTVSIVETPLPPPQEPRKGGAWQEDLFPLPPLNLTSRHRDEVA